MEDVPMESYPPVISNKHITFGYVGNVAKINDRIIQCWKKILESEPKAKLLIRSVNFYDDSNLEATKHRLTSAGLSDRQLDFRKALGGPDFFKSYDEIDIILDTFPFNGGTTSCFAAYMGVPLISWAGKSLVSRMGLSILRNMDASHYVVNSAQLYVQRALELASNVEFLTQFKKTARATFKASALGDGKLFAGDFEEAVQNSWR